MNIGYSMNINKCAFILDSNLSSNQDFHMNMIIIYFILIIPILFLDI